MKQLHSSVEVLSPSEIQAIHRSSLRILERVGVRVPHSECLALCRRAGAVVDELSQVVRIPPALMEEILAHIRTETGGEQFENQPAKLEGVISTQAHVVDYASGSRCPGLVGDVLKGIALVQHLRNFPTGNAVVIPSDLPAGIADIACFQMIYCYSSKPGGTYVLTPFSARHIVRMAQIMERRAWFLLDPVSPLQFRKESLEIAAIFARAGQLLYVGSMVMAGATGPATLAGTVTLHNAELLASLFLVTALTQGNRYGIYNSGPHSIDPRAMVCSFGSPNQALFGICVAQLGRFYGLRRVANVGLTDSLRPDFQAGFEKAASAVFGFLAGIETIGCQGLVGADQGFSFEQLVLDNEWMEFCNYALSGVEVTEETIAADLIETVGIGGSFVAEEHTVRHFRESSFLSKLLNRQLWEGWCAEGHKDALMRAREFVGATVGDTPTLDPVCTPEQFNELNRIMEEASAEVGHSALRIGHNL
jgi:trimethylamine--corrinoid protein Co-methyltransferase